MPVVNNTARHNAPDYNHISLAADALATEIGIHDTKSAVEDFCRHARQECIVDRGEDGVPRVIHEITRKPLKDWALTDYRKSHGYMWPTEAPIEMEEAAFGSNPNLTARGALRIAVGEAEYRSLAKKWNSDPVKLVPGRRPGDGDTEAPKPKKSTNPWADTPENVDQNGRWSKAAIRRQSNAALMGNATAQALALAAGSFVGSTGPKSRRLIPR
jgi:hypothetical protein